MNESIFDKLDFGPLRSLLDNDDITDISYCNNGQIWIRSLTQGSLRVEVEGATPEFVEKLAFQCSNVMGTTFNNAKPFLDAESAELRLNFVHDSIATNGIALVIRKTPAKIRLEKDKLIEEDYFTENIHDFLIKCVEGHCNVMVAGETGSGKTEFVKYLASHTKTSEKIITIEDTLELHLDRIFPQRDIVAMKTNNVASYSDVLVTCMRQNPKWILLSEVRSAEAVSAVRNSISSGHNILSTIHADKASAIPYRLYSLMETDLDVNQFLSTIYRYIQLGVHIKAFYSKKYGKFHRELDEVTEFYVDEHNVPQSRVIYQKLFGVEPVMIRPSNHLLEYLENQNIDVSSIVADLPEEMPHIDANFDENSEEQEVSEERKETEEETKVEQPATEEVEEKTEEKIEEEEFENIEDSVVEEEATIESEETQEFAQEQVPIQESEPSQSQLMEQKPAQVSAVIPDSNPVQPQESAPTMNEVANQPIQMPQMMGTIPQAVPNAVTVQATIPGIVDNQQQRIPEEASLPVQPIAIPVEQSQQVQPVAVSSANVTVQATIPGIVDNQQQQAAIPAAPMQQLQSVIPEISTPAVAQPINQPQMQGEAITKLGE